MPMEEINEKNIFETKALEKVLVIVACHSAYIFLKDPNFRVSETVIQG